MLHSSAFGKMHDDEQHSGTSSLQTVWRNVALYVAFNSKDNSYECVHSETINYVFPSASPRIVYLPTGQTFVAVILDVRKQTAIRLQRF
jgi:hypothetical protein